jgi:hypothetical protein
MSLLRQRKERRESVHYFEVQFRSVPVVSCPGLGSWAFSRLWFLAQTESAILSDSYGSDQG